MRESQVDAREINEGSGKMDRLLGVWLCLLATYSCEARSTPKAITGVVTSFVNVSREKLVLEPDAMIVAPVRSCPPNSRRDRFGNCRTIFYRCAHFTFY